MKVYKTITEIRKFVSKRQNKSIALVPTMGYLHQGHLALMEEAKEENDVVIVSIFVNPTQFGPNEDYDNYPRDIKRDAKLAESIGVDAIFHPEVNEIYNNQHATNVEITGITDKLCDATRPAHFAGVCTIVSKLFNIINPDQAYFGQKDAQQVLVIKKMVADLNFNIEIKTVAIIRAEDGLAVSSRNQYLNSEERKAATILFESLEFAKKIIKKDKKTSTIKQKIINFIEQEPLARIDYVELVDQKNLEELNTIKGSILIALAVYIGSTRLIDNLMMEV